MTEYKQVYHERIVEAGGHSHYPQFFSIELYEAKGQDSFGWPMMVKICTGFQGDEDWDQTWEIMDCHRTTKPAAIREVIKRLDNHKFGPRPVPEY